MINYIYYFSFVEQIGAAMDNRLVNSVRESMNVDVDSLSDEESVGRRKKKSRRFCFVEIFL